MIESKKKSEFLKLYEEHHPSLMRFARAISKNREDAKDLAAETIMIAYEKFDTLNSKQAFLSFLFTIASRIQKRRRWRQRFFGEYDEQKASLLKSHEPSPESGLEVELLYKALDKLPEKMKTAVVLFEISGLSIEEIRDIQGGSISGVKSRLVRGRAMLKEILNDKKVDSFLDETKNSGSANEHVQINDFSFKKTVEAGTL